jgi:transcriptional regulator with XRE-family HTH domain
VRCAQKLSKESTAMPARPKHTPNALDPLGEATINLRLWATYLQAGYTRSSFARALGVPPNTVSRWDKGECEVPLYRLIQCCRVLHCSADGILFGRAERPVSTYDEPPLTRDAIRALLDDVNATTEQSIALATHEESPEGRYQPITRSYVVSFVDTYRDQRAAGASPQVATAHAFAAAVNTRARVQAIALKAGVTAAPSRVVGARRPRLPVARPVH